MVKKRFIEWTNDTIVDCEKLKKAAKVIHKSFKKAMNDSIKKSHLYNCPICGWEPPCDFPDDRYIVILRRIHIIKKFWVSVDDRSYEADPRHVNDVSDKDKKITRYIDKRSRRMIYPQIKDGHESYDYYSGVNISYWTEIHKCPKHGRFKFSNANA